MKKITAFFIVLFSLVIFHNPVLGSDDEHLIEFLSYKAIPLTIMADLDKIIDRAGQRQLVLLGESSHGTIEFYTLRVEITKRLISEKKFSFVALEGDWSSIDRLNQYVKNLPGALKSAKEVLLSFDRWSEWMWKNHEIEQLAEWLRVYNMGLPDNKKVGFHGMDVYGPWDAMDNLLVFTKKYLPMYHDEIQRRLQCFAKYDRDEWAYAEAVSRGGFSCQRGLIEVENLLRELVVTSNAFKDSEFFQANQNALVVKNAEDYYRLAIDNNIASWNSRAKHMWLSVKRLFHFYGADSKGVVWAHNTHVGDSRATPMYSRGIVNIGSLSRSELGRWRVFVVGFSTNEGQVSAGSSWGSTVEKIQIPSGIKGSYEDILSKLKLHNFYFLFDHKDRKNSWLNQYRKHRAIGSVYNPENESLTNYDPTILPQRYDAFVFIRHTNPIELIK
jgi:erythromycin esterase-like protein